MLRSLFRTVRSARLAAALTLLAAPAALAQQIDTLPAGLSAQVRAAVTNVMQRTGVPSASVGIVRGGKVVYVEAFGNARMSPRRLATPAMHYAIGSISKQFTVAAVMLLQQEGKLSIDDPVSKWFPELTDASQVTLRNLMSHTSGYEDYAPQDYTIPAWTHPSSAEQIVQEWATKPLDFAPGTQYQYSNTNFNIVGLIVQKVAGEPFWQFLKANVLDPVGLSHTIDLDTQRDQLEPTGYFRHALGPLRPAILEAPGWYQADAEIAMPVGDLLTWDISMMNESLLSPASYAEMEAPTRLKDGLYNNYGLGLTIGALNGHRMVSHGGEVGGFVSYNAVLPGDKIAIAVLTNQEASPAAGMIGAAIGQILVPPAPTRLKDGLYNNYGLGLTIGALNGHRMVSHGGEVGGFVSYNAVLPGDKIAIAVLTNQEASPAAGMIGAAIGQILVPPAPTQASTPEATAKAEALARKTLVGLQQGSIDRAQFTANANFYFDRQAIGDYQSSLGDLGAIKSLRQTRTNLRGGMRFRAFAVDFADGARVILSTYTTDDGKYEQFLVEPGN